MPDQLNWYIDMKIDLINTDDGDLVIKLGGDFDAAGSAEIRPRLESVAMQAAPQHVFMDLRGVTFIDSSGVGAIVFMYKRLLEKSRQLRLVGAQGQPRELLELLRIHKAIPMVFPTTRESTESTESCTA